MSDEEKKVYASDTLGLPPLKMVLVQAENDRKNEAAQTVLESPESQEKRKKEKAVVRLIEHLTKLP